MTESLKKEMQKFADQCFSDNMDKYGFSFVPYSIFLSGFKPDKKIYDNWKDRMKAHRPSIVEHPQLYRSMRLFEKKPKNKEEGSSNTIKTLIGE